MLNAIYSLYTNYYLLSSRFQVMATFSGVFLGTEYSKVVSYSLPLGLCSLDMVNQAGSSLGKQNQTPDP